MNAGGAVRSMAAHSGSFSHGNSNFVQRNFGASHSGSFGAGHAGSFGAGHNGSFGAGHSGSFGAGHAGGVQHANFMQRNFSSGGHASGFAHQGFAHGGNIGRQTSLAGFHSASLGHSGFHGGSNFNHNFNSRWGGGWNNWGNRSYFFGYRSPFGAYYRGYYPWYRSGFWPGFGYLGLYSYYPYYYGYGYGYPYGYAYGSPFYGYGAYLNYSPYYGYGYPAYANYGYGYPAYSYNNYATQYGYDANYPASGALPTTSGQGAGPVPTPTPQDTQSATPSTGPTSVDDLTAADFAGQGEIDFKAGKYEAAARNFRHALVDDPTNAGALMLLGQALFAAGQYDEAAGATAMAMQALPQDKWGVVVQNRQQLYGNPADYTTQVRALEKARDAQADSPALHFLLGFQYAFSGAPDQGVPELDKTLQLQPKDQMAKALRDLMAGKTGAQPLQRPPAVAPRGAPGAQPPNVELR